MTILKKLGANVRKSRKAMGYTQERLADLSKIDPKYCGQLERGEVNISIVTLARVAKALDVKLNSLITGIDG